MPGQASSWHNSIFYMNAEFLVLCNAKSKQYNSIFEAPI